MWIRNKATNTLQEIHNADVIKVCRKEPEKYELSEDYPGDNEAVKEAEKKANEEAEKAAKEVEENAKTEAKSGKSEEDAKTEEEANKDNEADQAAIDSEGAGSNANTAEDYDKMKINDLRKIAKEKGIQGYNNMDKATLIAVIQAH